MKKLTSVKLTQAFLLVCCVFFFNVSFSQQWNILGNESQISPVATSFTSITVLGNIPYVAYIEGSASGGIAKVKRKNFSTDTWDQVGSNVAANATYTRIYSDRNNNLYVTYVDVSNGNKLAVVIFDTTAQAWVPLSAGNLYVSTGTVTYSISQFSGTPRSGLTFDNNGIPYITFSERTAGNNNPYVKTLIGGAWQTVGPGAVSTDTAVGNNIAIDDNNVPYVVYMKQATPTATTGSVKVFRFNSGTGAWEDVSPPSPVAPGSSTTGATTAVRHTSIAMDSSFNPVVSYFNTSNSNKSTIIRFNKSTSIWNFIAAISTRDAPLNSLVNDAGGNVYNMFADALINGGLSSMVRVFKLYRGASGFSELKSQNLSRGIDSTGDNTTTARTTAIGDLNLAVGSDTSKPFIVYTKTNSGGIRTPIVQIFAQPIITAQATNITSHSATTGGDVSNLTATIHEKGIVYGTSINPTTSDSKIIDSSGSNVFISNIDGLIPATSYFVRAYAVTDSGTVYGNNIAFITNAPDSTSVTVGDLGSTVVMNNGIVKATIQKSSGFITSLIYNGIELINGGFQGGMLYWTWNMPNFQEPTGCTYTLTVDPHTNNFSYAEIKLHMSWNGTPSTAAMDVDIYFSLPKGASGIYASATLSHPSSYPDLPGGEWRMAGYPNPRFDWMSVDSLRNRIMPSGADLNASLAVAGAPPEVTLLTTGIYKNNYECKYDYSADFGVTDVWGWSSTADNVGLWITAPSKEYYPGGPMKRELMCHTTPVILNMLGGTHYGMGDQTDVAAGETWQKTYGPFLIYCNKVDQGTSDAPHVLWNNARTQAKAEQAAWPYSWYTNPNYVQENNRGTVTGKLIINEPGASAANMWVGLAKMPPGSTNVNDFQRWSKNYQFWVKTDDSGRFTIPHVLPDTYNLYAFGPGAAGQMTRTSFVTVTPGSTVSLDTVQWTPFRLAPTVWEIGVPDRSAAEFKHGADWWTSNIFPDPRWGKFMNYNDEFPNDVNFTIGQSNPSTDWNFVMPYDKSVQSTSPKWTVNFNIPVAPVAGTNASVYVAAAAGFSAALILNVNDSNITVPTTGILFSDPSDAMIRKGIHGAFSEIRFTFPANLLKVGDNHISFTLRTTGGSTAGDIMFDYLRLEANIPPCTTPTFSAIPDSVITTATRANGCDTVVNYTITASGYPTPSLSYSFTGATTGSGTGTGSGSTFNRGTTTVTVAAANKCDSVLTIFNITVNDSLPPVLTKPADQFFCYAGTNYQVPALKASDNCSITSSSYSITGATTRSGAGLDASGAFNVGQSTITWTVTDEQGNTTTASTNVRIDAPLIAAIPDVYAIDSNSTDKNTIYKGYGPTSLSLQALPIGSFSYQWNTGATTSSISVTAAGTYTVTVTDSSGCTATASIVINTVDVECGINNKQVTVCHNGFTFCLPPAAVQVLLGHGYKLGPCTSCTSCNSPALSVYPNPTTGQFTVALNNYHASKVLMAILGPTGQVVALREVMITGNSATISFNISNFPNGVYFVTVISTDGIQVGKILLQK